MQRSALDRIYLAFLIILIVSFGFLIFFISFFTRRSLITEKQSTLTNEANLVASQVVRAYMSGEISTSEMASQFNDCVDNHQKGCGHWKYSPNKNPGTRKDYSISQQN